MIRYIVRNLFIVCVAVKVIVTTASLSLTAYAEAKLDCLSGWSVVNVNYTIVNNGIDCWGITYPGEQTIYIYNQDGLTLLHEVGHAYSVEVGMLYPDHDTTPIWFDSNEYMHTDVNELSANAYVESWLFGKSID